jgi:hypothetical protein
LARKIFLVVNNNFDIEVKFSKINGKNVMILLNKCEYECFGDGNIYT